MQINAPRVWRYNQKRRKYLGRVGEVLGWSVVRVAPEGMEQRMPYIVGLIAVEQENTLGQIVDVKLEEMKMGMKVRGVVRRLFNVDPEALVVYGVKWKPVND